MKKLQLLSQRLLWISTQGFRLNKLFKLQSLFILNFSGFCQNTTKWGWYNAFVDLKRFTWPPFRYWPRLLSYLTSYSGDFRRPNKISAQNLSYVINRSPKLASKPSCLPMGPIGLALNGVPIFNPFTMTCCDAGDDVIITELKIWKKILFLSQVSLN